MIGEKTINRSPTRKRPCRATNRQIIRFGWYARKPAKALRVGGSSKGKNSQRNVCFYRGITESLSKRLDSVLSRSNGDYVFTMKSGRSFDIDSFRKNPWTSAFKKASITYKVPYTMRHSFAAWSLTIGVDINRLENLMGHASKQMIYEVYGKYVEGLETDAGKILDYFGKDFNRL